MARDKHVTNSVEGLLKQQDAKVEASGAIMETLDNSKEMEATTAEITIQPPSSPHPTPMLHTSQSFL